MRLLIVHLHLLFNIWKKSREYLLDNSVIINNLNYIDANMLNIPHFFIQFQWKFNL